jgi:RNA polymerase sigma-70 factor (ECF subfamily)
MDDETEFTGEVKLAQEAALVRRASQGDAIALTKLYETHIDDIYRFCYSQVRNISDAETLTSETFLRAIEALSQGHFTWQGKPFGAWLYGIASRVVQEYRRKSLNLAITEEIDPGSESTEPVSEQPEVLDIILQREERDALWQLVKELTIEEQRILVFRHVYDMSYAEIARRLGSSENACKQAHYRVLKKLKLKAQEVDLWNQVTNKNS